MNIVERFVRSRFGLRPALAFWRRAQGRRRYRHDLKSREAGDCLFASSSELRIVMGGEVYLNDLEIPLLARYAQQAPHCIVEIGAAFGASSVVFLAHCGKAARMNSIDPFVVDSMVPFQATQQKCQHNVRTALRVVGRDEKFNQWNLIPAFSYDVVKKWNSAVDAIFIDGDHRYEAVRKDFEDWFPHVRSGGFILFHDSCKTPGTPEDTFNQGWPGPTRVALELASDSRVTLVETAYSISVFQKR